MSKVEVIVSGLAWMGAGRRSIESTIDELLDGARNEVLITAYSIGNASDRIFGGWKKALNRGVRIRMIVNRLDQQAELVVQELQRLQAVHPNFELYSFESSDPLADLHAKTIVIDGEYAIVGSANISFRSLTTNHELALLVDAEAASQIATTVEKLFSSHFCKQII